jgi:predicted nucleotide-binding protein
MLTPEQVETIDRNARIIIDGHLAAIHAVANEVLQRLMPSNKHEYSKHFEALISGTLTGFSELDGKLANEVPKAILALKPDINEQDRDEVLALWRRRLDTNVYGRRLESFKESFGRRMQGYGIRDELSTFRFDLVESRYLAGTANASRLAMEKLKDALDLRVYADRGQYKDAPPMPIPSSINTDYSFKKHPLTADQRLWLSEVARVSSTFSPRAARIALQGRVAPGFSPDTIDPRLYANRRLTPVGLWHVDPNSPQFDAIDKTIRAIRERILQQPDIKSVTAGEIAAHTGLTEGTVGDAFFAAGELGTRFFSKADGIAGNQFAYAKLYLPDDDSADDEYLNYTNIEDLLERFYTRLGRALRNAISYSERESGSMSIKRVFIVHGHNGEAKESVARFVEKLNLEAIILHERPNKGRTIITKFQEESDGVGFAVVLMTPDDEGRAASAANAKPRARQNVVFELGFFIGKLGPGRVAALVKGDIEKPSDLDGVVYISLDSADWRVNLATEFRAAGLAGDWSKVLA